MAMNFYLKKNSVYLHYRKMSSGRKADLIYYTNIVVTDDLEWNPNQSQFRTSKSDPRGETLNKQLKRIKDAAEFIESTKDIFELKTKEFCKLIDQELLANDLGLTKVVRTTFFDFSRDFFEKVKAKKGYERSKSIQTMINLVEEFRPSMCFEDVTFKWFDSWVEWLEEKGYSKNYIKKNHTNLIRVMKKATRDGVNKCTDYREFKYNGEKVFNVNLTEQMIEKIYAMTIDRQAILSLYDENSNGKIKEQNIEKQIESLIHVRKLMIIGCWTGMRSNDYLKINPFLQIGEDEAGEYISAVTCKTHARVRIPLHWMIKEIHKEGWPAQLSQQKFNKQIKTLVKLAGFKHMVEWGRTEGGEFTRHWEPFYNMVASHTMRRSFASNLIRRGVAPHKVMAMTGHKSETVFWNYVGLTEDEISKALSTNPVWKKNEQIMEKELGKTLSKKPKKLAA